MKLTELLEQLRAEEDEWRKRAHEYAEIMRQAESEAGMRSEMIDRILATDEARTAATPVYDEVFSRDQLINGSPKSRKPRRDIRKLVRDYLDEDPHLLTLTKEERVSTLSRNLKRRPSQIEAALRTLDGHVELPSEPV